MSLILGPFPVKRHSVFVLFHIPQTVKHQHPSIRLLKPRPPEAPFCRLIWNERKEQHHQGSGIWWAAHRPKSGCVLKWVNPTNAMSLCLPFAAKKKHLKNGHFHQAIVRPTRLAQTFPIQIQLRQDRQGMPYAL